MQQEEHKGLIGLAELSEVRVRSVVETTRTEEEPSTVTFPPPEKDTSPVACRVSDSESMVTFGATIWTDVPANVMEFVPSNVTCEHGQTSRACEGEKGCRQECIL